MTEDKKNEVDNLSNDLNSSSAETPMHALQTKIAEDAEALSHLEMDDKLEQAQVTAKDYHQSQASKANGLEAFSAADLALEEAIVESEKLECLNCAAPLQGPYCHNCGQPDRHFIRFFPKVLWEMINEALDLDSRTYRTLVPLLLFPGRLTMEYIAGRRARYVNPLRLYVLLSVIFFISISLFTDAGNNLTIQSPERVNVRVQALEDVTETLKEQQVEAVVIPENVVSDLETAIVELENIPAEQSKKSTGLLDDDGSPNVSLDNGKKWNPETNPIPFNGMFSAETTNELNVFLWKMYNKLDKAIKNDTSELIDEFLSAIPQLMFILLPLFALLLKFTYIFKKRYYMEHLLVALHSHCFIFFSLLLILLFSTISETLVDSTWLKETLEILVVLLAVWIPLNLYITQKKIYAQGYLLTTLKFAFVGVAYWALLTLTAAIAFVVGLVKL